jgi:uncharacterized membrane protein YjdF
MRLTRENHDAFAILNLLIFSVFLLTFFGFWIYSIRIKSDYRIDFWFISVILILIYALKKPLRLHPFHFALFGGFLLLHNFGTLGFYKIALLGLEYDFYPHFVFGLSTFFIAYHASYQHWKHSSLLHIFALFFLILLFSMIHEGIEYTGYVALGKGDGFLKLGAGDLDAGDSQKDIGYGLLGAACALSIYNIKIFCQKRRKIC